MIFEGFLCMWWQLLQPLINHIANNPVMLRSKRVTIFYYGIWMGLAYSIAKLMALYYLSHHFQKDRVQAYLLVMFHYMFPLGVLGARAMSWILEDGWNLSKVFRPGFYWHGGLVGALSGVLIGAFVYSLPAVHLLDAFGLAMPAFEVFNRTGCLSYGCCWGKVAPKLHPRAIKFEHKDSCIHRKNVECKSKELYPVQVYAVLLSVVQGLIIFPLISAPQGFLFTFGMATSSLVRLVCENYRGDDRGSGIKSTQAFATAQMMLAFALSAAFVLPCWAQGHTYWSAPVANSEGFLLLRKNEKDEIFWSLIASNVSKFMGTFAAALLAYGTRFH